MQINIFRHKDIDIEITPRKKGLISEIKEPLVDNFIEKIEIFLFKYKDTEVSLEEG